MEGIIRIILLLGIAFVLFVLFIPIGRFKETDKVGRLLSIGPLLLINLNLLPLFFIVENITNFESNLQIINLVLIFVLIIFHYIFRSIELSLFLFLLLSATSLLLLINHFF